MSHHPFYLLCWMSMWTYELQTHLFCSQMIQLFLALEHQIHGQVQFGHRNQLFAFYKLRQPIWKLQKEVCVGDASGGWVAVTSSGWALWRLAVRLAWWWCLEGCGCKKARWVAACSRMNEGGLQCTNIFFKRCTTHYS